MCIRRSTVDGPVSVVVSTGAEDAKQNNVDTVHRLGLCPVKLLLQQRFKMF